MENNVTLKDLRLNLTNYTNRVEKTGQSFLVTRKSKPVFKIVPADQNEWETVVDFTKINPDGVPAEKVLAALKKLAKQ